MNIEPSRQSANQFLDSTFDAEGRHRIDGAMSKTGQPLDVVTVELGVLQEEKLANALARFFSTEYIREPASIVDLDLVSELGESFLARYTVLPVRSTISNQAMICVADPFNGEALELIGYATRQNLEICIATRSDLKASLDGLSISKSTLETSPENEQFELTTDDLDRLKSIAEEAPVVRLISRIFQLAVDAGATDIHIEPMAHRLQIRMRIDGVLTLVETVASNMLPGIATRIKILAKLNISERRLPQDGRMRTGIRGIDIDFRVSIMPSVNGETIVLRVLDRSRVQLDLAELGFDYAGRKSLKSIAQLSNGIVLITGPTGSGKTTSLYAMINMIDAENLKLFTVEDPVEYPMDGITQLQVNPDIGLTFASSLRSVLRQDPDVILVGEIRDKETAELAMQAALTGHLVLSTLHTNSAAGTVTRLRDMGIDDYLIGATVKAAIGQRLLRKTCQRCNSKKPDIDCDNCNGSGLKGRTVTYEISQFDEAISQLVSQGKPENDIAVQALKSGMMPMLEHAKGLVKTGVTSQAELLRVLQIGL